MKAAEEYNIEVPGQMEGTRIDKFLSDYFNDMSRNYLQKLIKDELSILTSFCKLNGIILKKNAK